MCGRYSLITSVDELKERFDVTKIDGKILPNYNAAPDQQLPLITSQNQNRLRLATWGLLPAWLKDEKSPKRLINAKAETLAIKPTFKQAAEKRRCLIVADGFYEWAKIPNSKIKMPFRITLKNNSPFAMAGIYEIKRDKNGQEYLEFAIITTSANTLMAKIHSRMPAILLPNDEKHWLNPNITLKQAIMMLRPYPASKMRAYPVSNLVNNPKNNSEAILKNIDTLRPPA